MFGLLHSHRLVFQGCREVGGGVSSFAFAPEPPFEARAGQHGILQLGGTARKPFSLASAPEEDSVLIGTSLHSGSSFKQRLAALRPGDTVTLRGPVNRFTLDGAAAQVVMLAQGVGITPLRSMLAHAALTNMNIESSLIHVAHAGHAYREETQQWATAAAYPQHADDFRAAATAAAHDNPDATFFIAGATPFVSSTASLLRDAGIAGANIREDKYLGYKPRPRTATTPITSDVPPANARPGIPRPSRPDLAESR
jgi:glycine betaine catabolism B